MYNVKVSNFKKTAKINDTVQTHDDKTIPLGVYRLYLP